MTSHFDKLLAHSKQVIPIECPTVPDERFFVRRISLEERLAAETALEASGKDGTEWYSMLALWLCDADRQPLMTAEQLLQIDAPVVLDLWQRACAAQGIGRTAEGQAEKK